MLTPFVALPEILGLATLNHCDIKTVTFLDVLQRKIFSARSSMEAELWFNACHKQE
jgi:hypothetical protein